MYLNFFRACRSTLVGLRWVLWSALFGIAKSFPKWWTVLIHTPTNTVEKFLLLHVYQHFIPTDLNFSHSGGLIKRAHVALIYISLLDSEVSAHWIFTSTKYLSCHLSIFLFVLLAPALCPGRILTRPLDLLTWWSSLLLSCVVQLSFSDLQLFKAYSSWLSWYCRCTF